MTDVDHLRIHLEICLAVCEQMKAEGNWPWSDSQNPEKVVESGDTPDQP